MKWLDILLGILLALNIFNGLKNGFFQEVGGLAGLIAGLFVGIVFDERVTGFLIQCHIAEAPWANVLGFLIPFLIVFLLFVLLSKVFSQFFKALSLGWMNRLAGALFSLVKGAFILSIILNLYEFADKDRSLIGQERIEASRLYKPLLGIAPSVFPSFPDGLLKDLPDKMEEVVSKKWHV